MTDRHKRPPIPFRPSERDESWLRDHARRTGLAVNAVLAAALAAYRKHHEEGEGQAGDGG